MAVDEAVAHEKAVEILNADDIAIRCVAGGFRDLIIIDPGAAGLNRPTLALLKLLFHH